MKLIPLRNLNFAAYIGTVCCALILTGFDSPEETVITGQTMGTSYRLVLSSPPGSTDVESIKTDVNAALNTLEDQMSTWRADSELSKFNATESTDWFPVSHDTAFVVSNAKTIWNLSDGAFDPTVAPLIRLWHFSADPGERTIPTDADIAQAQSSIGFDQIEVRLKPPSLRKKHPALQLDLSAIAKGYAVDIVSELLTDRIDVGHLVEIGGEMRSYGNKPDGTSWTVGIETPDALPRHIHAALSLMDQSLATSGDYRNFFEVDGQRYSHTINPATGRPVTHNLASVSVITDDCLTADALATAIEVLGPERGLELAEHENVPAYLILRNESGFQVKVAGDFPLKDSIPFPQSVKDESNPVTATVLAAVGIFALAIAGMAVGVIFSNRTIKGSCGGLANMPGNDGKSICELCTVPAEECRDEAMRKIRQQAADCQDAECDA